jgi:hypothetical protein
MSEKKQSRLINANEADIFLGTLGVTIIYPHRDNTYIGVI